MCPGVQLLQGLRGELLSKHLLVDVWQLGPPQARAVLLQQLAQSGLQLINTGGGDLGQRGWGYYSGKQREGGRLTEKAKERKKQKEEDKGVKKMNKKDRKNNKNKKTEGVSN